MYVTTNILVRVTDGMRLEVCGPRPWSFQFPEESEMRMHTARIWLHQDGLDMALDELEAEHVIGELTEALRRLRAGIWGDIATAPDGDLVRDAPTQAAGTE